ncbi:hypothetical protein QBC37DRAFT_401668 [Rhypophila decipiens]|uniref:Uncharacterized protein n=1 Tax=Rhypophila decipiens TaxID=261697 RepID=A0AAN7B8U4_9PEZI|nr:hypothetical protein QBC37DRAFT_401668 [Rhypophila decipiens]
MLPYGYAASDKKHTTSTAPPPPHNHIMVLLPMQPRASPHDDCYMLEPNTGMRPTSKMRMVCGRASSTLMLLLVVLISLLVFQGGADEIQTRRHQEDFALWIRTAKRNPDNDTLPLMMARQPRGNRNKN